MLKYIFKLFSGNAREKRSKIFQSHFNIDPNTTILDLGGGDGHLIATTLKNIDKKNVCVADIDKKGLERAKAQGFNTLELDESGIIPIEKNQFDIIFSNSVLEHVTVDKGDMYKIKSNKEFHNAAMVRQQKFANEIRAKSDKYYVQTPYKYFLIESHTWLPGLIVFLPRTLQMGIIKLFNKFWPKKTTPDWHLLTYKEMEQLFPDAKIIKEKSLFMVKSLIAIKSS
jgi:SAM-dependent methyltransferase